MLLICSLYIMNVLFMQSFFVVNYEFAFTGALACDSALFITAPERIEALSGSCLQIPCNFSVKREARIENDFNEGKNIFGIWTKDNVNFLSNPGSVIFNSSKTENVYPINIIGNLSQHNCTTLFSNLTSIISFQTRVTYSTWTKMTDKDNELSKILVMWIRR